MADDEFTGLLIEDSPTDALLLKALVEDAGHPRMKLLHAERLQDGLELLRDESIEIVLLDLSLPDAQGIATVTRTHAARQDVAIIVLTGLDDEMTAVQAMQEGAQDYLVKGQVDRAVLFRAIRYARERKRTERATHRLVREQAAQARAEVDQRHARFLTEASRALASSLEQDATLSTVVCLAVPAVADGCLVDLLDGVRIVRRVAAVSLDGGPPELWREELVDLHQPEDGPLGQALLTGEAAALTELPESASRALRLPERWSEPLPRSAVIVPMLASGRVLGTMTFLNWFPERRQGHESLWALELAGRVALAVANLHLRRMRERLLEVVSHDLRTAPVTPTSRPADDSSLSDSFLRRVADVGDQPMAEMPLPDIGETMGGPDGDRFKIQARIGTGSMGVVFQAKDRLLGRTVAIKVMNLQSTDSAKQAIDLFLVEARAIAKLNHENIIQLFDAGIWRQLPYLVIEHLKGNPLYYFLSQEQFSPGRAVRMTIQVLNGLEHAHLHGIVHRDLKPSNVFLLDDHKIKILDFGLAQMAAAMGSSLLPAHAGTPAYMAPEQWRGDRQDLRVDLWAVGVMLFEMLAGDRPFQAETTDQLREMVVADTEAASVLQLSPALPPKAGDVLARALQKRPERRFQTAAELRDALLELQGNLDRPRA
ncbi:MAG TPA: protein kinase [Myxococcales bacterium]|nr:protein kinase [Myxococcales bacterium]